MRRTAVILKHAQCVAAHADVASTPAGIRRPGCRPFAERMDESIAHFAFAGKTKAEVWLMEKLNW